MRHSPECCVPARPASSSREHRPRSCSTQFASSRRGAWLDPAVTRRVLDVYRAAPDVDTSARDGALALLTDRERDVLVLIGEGRTNSEIARALFVGEGTVKTHINHLFSKLSLRDRAAAVIFAYEHDLVGGGS